MEQKTEAGEGLKFVEEIKEDENESKNGRDSKIFDESKRIENSGLDIKVEELKGETRATPSSEEKKKQLDMFEIAKNTYIVLFSLS